jgi:hypothetical protein
VSGKAPLMMVPGSQSLLDRFQIMKIGIGITMAAKNASLEVHLLLSGHRSELHLMTFLMTLLSTLKISISPSIHHQALCKNRWQISVLIGLWIQPLKKATTS